ncbi:MAG: redoxin domain-containing protein, partial [Nitrososphaeraceae archaeon]
MTRNFYFIFLLPVFITVTFLLSQNINAIIDNDIQYPQSPSYSAKDLVGNIVNLDDFKNNYTVLINVWATWCGPCKEEMPGLEKLYKQFSSSGLKVIGVSIDNSRADNLVQSYINKIGITYDIWRDPNDIFSMTFKTIGVPASFLINQNGEIVHRWNGQFDPVSVETNNLVTNTLLGSETLVNKTDTNSSADVNSYISSELNQYSIPDNDNIKNYLLIGIPIAFLAGLLSFLSPCVLPLIPSFIAFITGMSLDDLKSI